MWVFHVPISLPVGPVCGPENMWIEDNRFEAWVIGDAGVNLLLLQPCTHLLHLLAAHTLMGLGVGQDLAVTTLAPANTRINS